MAKKEIRIVDKERQIVQITTADERWYTRMSSDKKTGLPVLQECVPSVTWITSTGYPKGTAYFRWLASKGWDEAEAIKTAAGQKGSKVHKAIEALLAGEEVGIDTKIMNPDTEREEELTGEEYAAIMSFCDWYKTLDSFKLLASEVAVFGTGYNDNRYAGTVDIVALVNGELWIIDLKTSQYVWPEHIIQLSAYKHAAHDWQDKKKVVDISTAKLGVLQVGYNRNKNRYKFTEVDDKFELFKSAHQIWHEENGKAHPAQKDYPMKLILEKKVIKSDD